MIGAPNSLNLNCKVRVKKEAPGPSVSEEIADIFTNYNIYIYERCFSLNFSHDSNPNDQKISKSLLDCENMPKQKCYNAKKMI